MRLAWRTLHHCVAHPLMALSELCNAFHDWTAAKAFPDDECESASRVTERKKPPTP